MEPHLGADLSAVRLHTSGESHAAAEQLDARAFTVGSDVHFGAGEFSPGTKEGDRLLAHELTHAIQGERAGIQRKAAGHGDGHDADAGGDHDHVSSPDEPAEKEADHVAEHVADDLHGGGDSWMSQQVYESQRLRMLVPRVYGLGDLSQIVDERAYAQAHALLASLEREIQTFVPVHAYREARNALSNYRFACLVGEPPCTAP